MESEAAVSSNMMCMKCHITHTQDVSLTTTWYHAPVPWEQTALRPTCEVLQLHSKHTWKSYWVNRNNNVIAKKTKLPSHLFFNVIFSFNSNRNHWEIIHQPKYLVFNWLPWNTACTPHINSKSMTEQVLKYPRSRIFTTWVTQDLPRCLKITTAPTTKTN